VMEGYDDESCTLRQSDIRIPSIFNSPWILGAPHPMLSVDIVWISLRTLGSTVGRPPGFGRDFHVQYNRKPFRCQRSRVFGLKIISVCKHSGHTRKARPRKFARSHTKTEPFPVTIGNQ